VDFLAYHPMSDDWELNDNLPGGEVFFMEYSSTLRDVL